MALKLLKVTSTLGTAGNVLEVAGHLLECIDIYCCR